MVNNRSFNSVSVENTQVPISQTDLSVILGLNLMQNLAKIKSVCEIGTWGRISNLQTGFLNNNLHQILTLISSYHYFMSFYLQYVSMSHL